MTKTKKVQKVPFDVLDDLPYPVAIFSAIKAIWLNRSFRKTFPTASGKSSLTLGSLLGRKNRPIVAELSSLLNDLKTGRIINRDVTVEPEETTLHTFDVTGTAKRHDDQRVLVVTLRDVTARENALQEMGASLEQSNSIVQGMGVAACVLQEEHFVFVNQAFLHLFGIVTIDDIIGKKIKRVIHAKGRRAFSDGVDKLQVSSSVRVDHEAVRVDGTHLIVESVLSRIEYGSRPSILCLMQDVTTQRNTEHDRASFLRSREMLDSMLLSVNETLEWDDFLGKSLAEAMHMFKYESGAVFVSDSAGEIVSLATNIELNEVASKLSHQSLKEGLFAFIVKTQEPSVITVADYPAFLPHKSLFESSGIQSVVFVPFLSQSSVLAVMMLASVKPREITDEEKQFLAAMAKHVGGQAGRAKAYSRMKASESRFRSAIEELPAVFYERSTVGGITFISPSVEKMLGFTPSDFISRQDLMRNLLHPDDRPLYTANIAEWAKGGDSVSAVYRILPKGKATYSWVRDSVWYRRDGDKNLVGVRGLLIDVTHERKGIGSVGEEAPQDEDEPRAMQATTEAQNNT